MNLIEKTELKLAVLKSLQNISASVPDTRIVLAEIIDELGPNAKIPPKKQRASSNGGTEPKPVKEPSPSSKGGTTYHKTQLRALIKYRLPQCAQNSIETSGFQTMVDQGDQFSHIALLAALDSILERLGKPPYEGMARIPDGV